MTEPAHEPSVEEAGAAGAGEPASSGARLPDDAASAAVTGEPPADRSEQVDDPGT